jgi:hypothetical protein
VPAHTFVIDVAPELSVVRCVGHLDLLPGERPGVRRQFQFAGIHLEKFQVNEYSLGIQDDASHLWGIAEAVVQGVDAPSQVSDVLVQFG